jgi:hypothetical protein
VFVGMFDESTVEEDACKCEHFHQTHR